PKHARFVETLLSPYRTDSSLTSKTTKGETSLVRLLLEILALLFAFEVMWNGVVLSNRGCLSQVLITSAYLKCLSKKDKQPWQVLS
ncbi:MAG: hypothetical protein QMB60_07530, partial [Pseudomonadales bacterium]